MKSETFIHNLLNWIDNHIEGRLDLKTVSLRAGYSKWHLQRIFEGQTGLPSGEYIRAEKLKRSAIRLTKSDAPNLNVAISFGYDSQQSFNRSFKRHYGLASGQWRKNFFRSRPLRFVCLMV